MKPVLYSYYRSSCAFRVRIALQLADVAYDYRPIHLLENGGAQHTDEFKTLNPKSEVPLYIDSEVTLSQSMAILLYLDKKHFQSHLFRQKNGQFYELVEACEIINSGIQPIQNLRVLQELKNRFEIDENAKIDWIKYFVGRGLQAFEKKIEKHADKFSFGSELSAADIFLVPQLFSARRFDVDLRDFSNCLRVEENCMNIEAFQKAAPARQPDAN